MMHTNSETDWEDLRVFLAVARFGSLSAAGDHLQLAHTTIGRRISNLEARVGGRLVARHAKGMRLTHRGRELATRLAAMETTAADLERHLLGSDNKMAG